MSDAVYVLDANVLIDASRRYYAFDIAPVFWESLVQGAEGGRVVSIDHVRDEIKQGHDELWDWVKQNFAAWFISTDDDAIIKRYGEVARWVQAQVQFTEAAKAAFHDGADGWLIACALNGGHVIVTHEVHSPDARRRVKIPNVCTAFGVRFIDTFRMLRELGVRWT
jgi:hypothetical protein